MRSQKWDLARRLAERGADPNTEDQDGRTPVMRAAVQGQVEVLRLLAKRGADLRATDKDYGKTPRHVGRV